MTIVARLRLLLAILALALPPLGVAAPSVAAVPPMVMASMVMPPMIMDECGGHDCTAAESPAPVAGGHHAAIACALGCLQAQMPSPLLLPQAVLPRPAVRAVSLALPAQTPLSAHAPSPPERPPRV